MHLRRQHGCGTDGRDPVGDGVRRALRARRARSKASSSATTTSWSATSATRRSSRRSSRPRSRAVSRRRPCSRCCAAARRSWSASTGSSRFLVEEAPAPRVGDGPPGRARVQDDRRPLRRAREPLPRDPGLTEDRRHALEQPHALRRAAAPDLRDAGQGAGDGHDARGRRPRGRGEAQRHHHRRRAEREGLDRRRSTRSSRPTPCSPSRSRPIRRATRTSSPTRCTGSRTKTPRLRLERNAETHQTLLWGMGETHVSIALEKLHAQVRRQRRHRGGAGPVPRDDHATRGGGGQVQEADRRSRSVRRRVAAARATRARRGLRVRRRRRRRRDPPSVHPGRREGRRRDDGARRALRLPRRRREGDRLRRQAPPRRQLRDELPDGRLDRLPGGDGEGRPDPARADQHARPSPCPRRTRAT